MTEHDSKFKFLTLLVLHHKETTGKISTKLAGSLRDDQTHSLWGILGAPQRDKWSPSGAASLGYTEVKRNLFCLLEGDMLLHNDWMKKTKKKTKQSSNCESQK